MMDGGLENKWLMDFDCSRHMTGDKKWSPSLTPLSHKEYVTFRDDKKGKVLGTGVIKVNNHFTLKDVSLVDKLRYNLLSFSQLVNADLDILFHKSGSKVLDSCGDNICGLLRGLPLLKFESNLIFASCHHGKMITTSHSLVNTMMIEQPGQLLYMNTIGPSRVRSVCGKWYALIIVDD
jgi:hypothetical protein